MYMTIVWPPPDPRRQFIWEVHTRVWVDVKFTYGKDPVFPPPDATNVGCWAPDAWENAPQEDTGALLVNELLKVVASRLIMGVGYVAMEAHDFPDKSVLTAFTI
jgi:hypothetical protein